MRRSVVGLTLLAAVAATAAAFVSTEPVLTARGLSLLAGVVTLGLLGRCRGRRDLTLPLLLAAAICHWTFYATLPEPRRAEKRSLRSVAAAFAIHLPPDEPLWTTPVDKEFRHSSLVYYLGRHVRTVSDTDLPPAGAFVIHFGDEPMYDPDYRLPVATTLVAKEERRGVAFRLLRVRGSAP